MNEVMTETMEMELAAEFLEVTNEAELEQLLGTLARRAVRGVSNFARAAAGKRLGGIIKGIALIIFLLKAMNQKQQNSYNTSKSRREKMRSQGLAF